jgi:hypothetical protein
MHWWWWQKQIRGNKPVLIQRVYHFLVNNNTITETENDNIDIVANDLQEAAEILANLEETLVDDPGQTYNYDALLL